MTKEEALKMFEEYSYVTLKCEMCGEKLRAFTDYDDIAKKAWRLKWRVQNDKVLCQYCTDDKR